MKESAYLSIIAGLLILILLMNWSQCERDRVRGEMEIRKAQIELEKQNGHH